MVRLAYITRNNVRKSKNGGRRTGQLSRACKANTTLLPSTQEGVGMLTIAQEIDGRKDVPWGAVSNAQAAKVVVAGVWTIDGAW